MRQSYLWHFDRQNPFTNDLRQKELAKQDDEEERGEAKATTTAAQLGCLFVIASAIHGR